MAKMLMGQINHARDRVKQLQKEKQGDAPEVMVLQGSAELLKGLRDGSIKVTGPQIKTAFDAFVNKDDVNGLHAKSGSYRNDYKETYKLKKRTATSVVDALACAVFAKANVAEADRFSNERELYRLRQAGIALEATKVEDAIVLGDQQAALIALRDFAKWSF